MKKNWTLFINVMIGIILMLSFVLSFRLINHQEDKINKLYQQIEFRDETIKVLKEMQNNNVQVL